MQTALYFICTCFVATGTYMVDINSKNAVSGILLYLFCGRYSFGTVTEGGKRMPKDGKENAC
jgi:hypothetical protein